MIGRPRVPGRVLVRRDGPRTAELARRSRPGALGQVPARLAPDATTASVCGYCSVGCSLDVHMQGGRPVSLSPSPDYPVNRGLACPKGWEALAPLGAADRGTTPLRRDARGRLAPVSWPAALAELVSRFRAIQERHGPEAVAFLSTGQITTEEMALLGALAKFAMGMVHGDGNTRQCMATAVSAYTESLGFDAPPYTYADLEESDVIVLVGSNLCITHPVLWERVCRNPHRPEVVVLDPRRTETAAAASHHCRLAPKSDLWLLYGVAHLLVAWDAVDHDYVAAHTSGYHAFAAHVRAFPPAVVSRETGLAGVEIERLAATVARGRRVSFWWTMGVNQSHEGVRVAQAIVNLALMTGSMGRPGTGANSITGQCNAMGSRLFSNTTGLFAGRRFEDPAHRQEVAGILGIDEACIPRRKSLAYDQILEGARSGRIKGLWVVATNTAHSWPDRANLERALDGLDFLVVQDMYATTETARRADLFLAAAGWGEKEGTFVNSERRLGLVLPVARPPGQALADFDIFRLVARAWGAAPMLAAWDSPEAVFGILQRLSRGRPCDISGIAGYAHLAAAGGIQWPFPAPPDTAPPATAGAGGLLAPAPPIVTERRLFEDGIYHHPDGRARFVWDVPRPGPELPSRQRPLRLLSGRGSSAQWHTQTRTAKSALLVALAPEGPYVEISPPDAAALGVADGDWVEVASARGAMEARAVVTDAVSPGAVFVPMHDEGTNRLTLEEVDPHSRQPSFKDGAVSVRRLGATELSASDRGGAPSPPSRSGPGRRPGRRP